MDTKVAKITRSWTSLVMSSPTPLREPSLLRRSPPGAQSDVFLTSNDLRRAAPPQQSQCPRFEPGWPGCEASYTADPACFLIATENLIDAGATSVQNSWIARGALAGCIMEHRGVRYELRRALGNDEWVWTVYTPAPKQGNVSGDRYFAMQRAMSVIDRWCGHDAESVPPQATQGASMARHERPSGRG
jgi:hypothetical protein